MALVGLSVWKRMYPVGARNARPLHVPGIQQHERQIREMRQTS
jgi:hypothetical protein